MVMKEELFYLLVTDEKFSMELIRQFPGLYSYITSIKQNPSKEHVNTCKQKIFEFYDTNDMFRSVIINYISNLEERRVDGRVFEVNNSEEYFRLINRSKTEKWKYKGLSVVESIDKIKVYFY